MGMKERGNRNESQVEAKRKREILPHHSKKLAPPLAGRVDPQKVYSPDNSPDEARQCNCLDPWGQRTKLSKNN